MSRPRPLAVAADVPSGRALAVSVGSERWALFRTDDGAYGLVHSTCPHQQGDMAAGRVDGEFLLCPLHAWCYDRNGALRRIPSRPDPFDVPDDRDLPAIPVRAMHGLIWAGLEATSTPTNLAPAPTTPWQARRVDVPPDEWWSTWLAAVPRGWLQPTPWDEVTVEIERVEASGEILEIDALGMVSAPGAAPEVVAALARRVHMRLRVVPPGVVVVESLGDERGESWWTASSDGVGTRVFVSASAPFDRHRAAILERGAPLDADAARWLEAHAPPV